MTPFPLIVATILSFHQSSPNMHRHEEEWTIDDDEDSVRAARQIIFRPVGTLFSIGEAYPRQELSFLSPLANGNLIVITGESFFWRLP